MAFIVLEGVDGAGKSTQIALLEEWFKAQGRECVKLHFPRFDAPVYGELIARFLRGEFGGVEEVNPYLVALLYAGDRADAAKMIRGWIDEGKVVIVDRYVYSNIGYQCAKLNTADERNKLSSWILDMEYQKFDIPRPDLSIFLDVPFKFTARKLQNVREGDDRNYLNGAEDIHESSLDLLRTVREVYLSAADTDTSLRVIDCSNGAGEMDAPQAIHQRIVELVKNI